MSAYGSHEQAAAEAAAAYGAPVDCTPRAANIAALTVAEAYGAAPAAAPAVAALPSSCDSVHPQMRGGYDAAATSTNGSASYGSHLDVAMSSSYDAPRAASPTLLSPAQPPQSAHAARSLWEEQHIFPWTQQQLIRAAQTVHSAGQHTDGNAEAAAAASGSPSSPAASSSVSASYEWRSRRWAYLSSYPATSWNALYQRLFEMVPSSAFELQQKARQQRELLAQFTHFARNTVELLMEEVHLPPHNPADPVDPAAPPHLHTKFLSPVALGGIAGGEKFVLNETLFKFANDWAGLFGGGSDDGDCCVQKSAANEIRHMNALIAHDGQLLLHAPLSLTMTCLLRVRGCVVMCTALAPIQGRQSLVYGSADAGRDVRDGGVSSTGDAAVTRVGRVVSQLASAWNLAPHPVADASGCVHTLPLACDIELHESRTDGRMYMLDLARFLPPAPPSAPRTMEHLYAMLRPELMRTHLAAVSAASREGNGAPSPLRLSADAFSGFGSIDHARYAGEVQLVMRHAKYVLMPRSADQLREWWEGIVALPSTTAAQMAKPCAVTSADDTEKDETATGQRSTSSLSVSIAEIVHRCGVNVRYLALVRAYVPAEPSPNTNAPAPATSVPTSTPASASAAALPSLSTLLLYEMVCRTLKQTYFRWIRRMMLAVGRMHQEEQGCSPSADGPAAAPAAHAANSGRAGWTDADLERWMRRVTMQQQPQQQEQIETETDPARPAVASTCHHESALLFALLLSQLFRPAPTSSNNPGAADAASGGDAGGFFQAVLWPELRAKFGKWSLGPDRDQFVAECHARGQLSVSLRSARMPLLSTEEQDQFERDCRSVTATSPSGGGGAAGSTARISIFLRMLIESVGLDWAGLQRALQRMGVPAVHTPLEYVRQLVPAVMRLDEPSSSTAAAESAALTPSVVALLFMPSFEPLLKRVDCLPFLGMAEAEAQLLATLASRSGSLAASGQSQENPALLGTLWALIALYQVHREEDPKAAAPPADSSVLPPASTGGALQRQQSSGESCYAKGCAILSQIERIYAAMLAGPSELHGPAAEPQAQVQYARFGWFHLSFGRLDPAREYFVREHLLRLEGARRFDTQQQSEAQNSAHHVASPAHASALLLLAKSLESLGVIERECGESLVSIKHLQECLRVYRRLYGREGLDFGEEGDAPDATGGAAAAPAPAASSDGTTSAPADSSDAASAFRHSMELCTLLTNLANSHGAAGQLASKRRFLERALSIVRGRHSTQGGAAGEEGGGGGESLPHPSLVSIVNNLSTCYSHASATEAEVLRAREMLEQAVRWNRQINRTTKRSAVDQQHQQQQQQSDSPAGAELDPSQLEFEDEHFSSAALFTNLANVYGKLGEHAKKVSLLQRALSLTERRHGSQLHPDCAVILTNLGMAQGMGGQLAKGLQTLQQALVLKTRLYGTPVHSEVALSLSNMSVLYGRGGDLQQEMRSLTQALQIYMAVLQKQAVVAREAAKSAAPTTPSAAPVPAPSSGSPADALPASASALASNPALVFVQQRLFRCKQRMMQQQRDLLSEGRCTFVASGSNRTVHARWFKCATCSPNPKSELGVCTSCAEKCHKGHVLAEQPPALFYCDCGEGVFATPCRAINAANETKAAPQVDVAAVGPASPPEVAAAEPFASAQPATVIPAAAVASSAAAPSPRPSLHIGIVGCSAEGAALCYRTICAEGAAALGLAHAHPEVSLHTPSLAAYTACIDRDDWPAVGELMLQSASKLARAGADFVICPDNTIHRALSPALLGRSALPWLHIAEVVAAQAQERGYKRVGLTGTQWLVESEVYPAALRARGLEFARPSEAERATLTRAIMGELVPSGSASPASVAALQCIIARLRDEEGCDSVVLGCTELPLVLNDANSALPTLDSTRLLARAALRRAVDGAAVAAAKPADATAASHAQYAADRRT